MVSRRPRLRTALGMASGGLWPGLGPSLGHCPVSRSKSLQLVWSNVKDTFVTCCDRGKNSWTSRASGRNGGRQRSHPGRRAAPAALEKTMSQQKWHGPRRMQQAMDPGRFLFFSPLSKQMTNALPPSRDPSAFWRPNPSFQVAAAAASLCLFLSGMFSWEVASRCGANMFCCNGHAAHGWQGGAATVLACRVRKSFRCSCKDGLPTSPALAARALAVPPTPDHDVGVPSALGEIDTLAVAPSDRPPQRHCA